MLKFVFRKLFVSPKLFFYVIMMKILGENSDDLRIKRKHGYLTKGLIRTIVQLSRNNIWLGMLMNNLDVSTNTNLKIRIFRCIYSCSGGFFRLRVERSSRYFLQ